MEGHILVMRNTHLTSWVFLKKEHEFGWVGKRNGFGRSGVEVKMIKMNCTEFSKTNKKNLQDLKEKKNEAIW